MRTDYCGKITEEFLDQTVTLYGWVHRRRDHGGVIFVDLRDREGLVQVVVHPENKKSFALAEKIRNEFVLKVKGQVRYRPDGTKNLELYTGQIEINVDELEILNEAKTPPFMLDEHHEVGEETRLKYRYLDLRRAEMSHRIKVRAQVMKYLRDYLEKRGFLDIETPFLTKATPEGARDYLVPSRTHQGSFYALPQSPQLFKQILMIAGFDRYYQVVRCFRDEDLRADRQPEFTQLDIETSFMQEEDIMSLMEEMIRGLFKATLDVELPAFIKMPYAEAIKRFGIDRPDLRIPLELVDIAELVKECDFKVFSQPANDPKGRVVALKLPEGGKRLSRKEIDDLGKFVAIYGAKGLAYIKINDAAKGAEGCQSPIVKFLGDDVIKALLKETQAQDGDLLFFG